MKIKRQELLDELYHFATMGDGMVVGLPGIGKSYMLRRLKENLVSKDILCFIIKIDNTYDSSDEAIAVELGIQGNWIDILNSIELRNENKAVLIFDAFDAARDEEKRRGFLTQIRKAKAHLNRKWNIIVSARTYDAKKSSELLKLFSPSGYGNEFTNVRKLTINELNENDLQEASGISTLHQFYTESNNELKKILLVPFFLKMLELILADSGDENIEEIKHFKSETQLLDYFWNRKIENTDIINQIFLRGFTQKLVEGKTLSISKADLEKLEENNYLSAYKYLRSEFILDEVSFRNSRVAYSHNIFFDYAVNRLCIDHNYKSLIEFISKDYSRAFFLRPSFIYFFTSIWYEDKKTFWDLYQNLRNNQQKEIQLFVRLIINGAIALQFSNVNDLNYVLKLNGTSYGNESIRNILQSIRFLRKNTLPKDIHLLNYLSKDLQIEYLFEFTFLLNRAIENIQENHGNHLIYCGESSRNLLFFIINNRNSDSKIFLDRIGSSRAVELVAKTLSTDPYNSKEALKAIFPLINEPGFDINYFLNLSDSIQYFVDHDPQLVADIYYLIFDHQEKSDEKTQMGTSVVMNLTSNRRQDFSMCYFQLVKFFPSFLSAWPELALATGVEVVNRLVYNKRVGQEIENGFTFDYQGIICTFHPDFSSYWFNQQFRDEEVEIGEHIIKFIKNLYFESKDQNAEKLVRIYIEKAKVGLLWKMLMNLANEYPTEMFDIIFPLIKFPKFFSSTEVSYEIRSFLEKVQLKLTTEQLKELELIIFEAYPNGNEYGIQAALSALKSKSFQTDLAKDFMATRTFIENKRPVESSFSVSTFTTEDWLKEQGVNTEDPEISKLTKSVNYLEAFNNHFLNNVPSYPEIKPYLDVVAELWETVGKGHEFPEEFKYTLLKEIAKTAAIAARNTSVLSTEYNALLKEIINYSFNYMSKYDEEQNDNSPAHGYSPTPRIEATQALPLIFIHDESKEFLELYEIATTDRNSVVRYNAIKNLSKLYNNHYDIYRKILFDRFENEKDPFNYSALFSVLHFKNNSLTEDGIAIIKFASRKTSFLKNQNSFVNTYSEFLLWLLSQTEITIVFENIIDGYQYRAFAHSIIFNIFKQIHIYETRQAFLNNKANISLKLRVIDQYIKNAGEQLIATQHFDIQKPEIEDALKTFDEIVMRIYFSLDLNQRISKDHKLPANEENRKDLYFLIKPLIEQILRYSSMTTEKGIMLAHTAHYLMQTLNSTISFDAKSILSMVADVTRYSMQVGYTFDSYAIREIVSLTEKLLADHRDLLLQDDSFHDLLSILEIHVNSGWVDALELLWKLDEVFK